jgi:methionyl-tRNA synthetase
MASGFVNLRGKAFSTSRNRAIWADDYLEEGFDPDLLRYYLVTTGGFQQDIDFSWERFQERVNGELVGNFGNFVYRSLLFAHRNFDGTPEADPSEEVLAEINEAMEGFRAGLNDYSLREASQAGIELSRFGNEYIQRHEPWKLVDEDEERARRAVLLEPVLPGTSERLWTQLGEEGSVHDASLSACLEEPPAAFDEPDALFEKLEDERVERLNEQLEARIDAATGAAPEAAEIGEDAGGDEGGVPEDLEVLADDRIGFEEFQDLDIRVGEVEVAEPIEGSDDLARLEVDIGVETRQIVAGIKRLHDLESLPGTRVVILANLEPAELFGVESNGMLLAAGEDADLLTTLGESEPGTKVR